MKYNRPHPGFIVIAAAASALALYYGTGLHPIWWLTWLSPLPLLLMAPRLSPGVSFAFSYLAAATGALNLWRYFRQSLESPLPISLLVILFPSAVFVLGILFFRRFIIRGSLFGAVIVFPSFLVTYEYLQCITSPHGTAFNLAYRQMNLPLCGPPGDRN